MKVLDPAGTGVGPFTKIYDDASVGRQLMDPITKDSTVTASTVSSDVTSNLPTLNPVALTSGPDVVTPTSDVEQISASLGGSTPTLGRDDVIDGGSGNDIINIDADASFLLGFSTGRMSGVETMNIVLLLRRLRLKFSTLLEPLECKPLMLAPQMQRSS